MLSKLRLWASYYHIYQDIQRKPALRQHMASDPGFKWMRRATLIIIFLVRVIIALLAG